MWRAVVVLLFGFGVVLAGCPESKTPKPSSSSRATAEISIAPDPSAPAPAPASATAVPKLLSGRWTVWLRSDSPAINPDFFDTPEKKAKVLFDHEAGLDEGRIRVVHKTLQKDWLIKDEALAKELDALVRGTAWDEVKQRIAKEKPSEGATEFTLTVTLGEQSPLQLTTTDIDQHPELRRLKDILKDVAGMPRR